MNLSLHKVIVLSTCRCILMCKVLVPSLKNPGVVSLIYVLCPLFHNHRDQPKMSQLSFAHLLYPNPDQMNTSTWNPYVLVSLDLVPSACSGGGGEYCNPPRDDGWNIEDRQSVSIVRKNNICGGTSKTSHCGF